VSGARRGRALVVGLSLATATAACSSSGSPAPQRSSSVPPSTTLHPSTSTVSTPAPTPTPTPTVPSSAPASSSVTLLRNGDQLGQPSQPVQSVPHSIKLKPGDTAESQLHDYTSCQAPLSDSARVKVPGSDQTVLRPVQMRGCTLRVDPLGPPA